MTATANGMPKIAPTVPGAIGVKVANPKPVARNTNSLSPSVFGFFVESVGVVVGM
jgi:hypothetical protein